MSESQNDGVKITEPIEVFSQTEARQRLKNLGVKWIDTARETEVPELGFNFTPKAGEGLDHQKVYTLTKDPSDEGYRGKLESYIYVHANDRGGVIVYRNFFNFNPERTVPTDKYRVLLHIHTGSSKSLIKITEGKSDEERRQIANVLAYATIDLDMPFVPNSGFSVHYDANGKLLGINRKQSGKMSLPVTDEELSILPPESPLANRKFPEHIDVQKLFSTLANNDVSLDNLANPEQKDFQANVWNALLPQEILTAAQAV